MKTLAGIVLFVIITTTSGLCCSGRNSTVNTFLAVGQLAEVVVDNLQTVRNLRRPHGTENDNLVPPIVVRAYRSSHPGLGIALGVAVVGTEYAIFRCKSPFYMTVGLIGEGVNLRLNYLTLKGK